MEQIQNKPERVHRVGSITAGVSMIVYGVLFVLHELTIIEDISYILKLWPLVLVGLGVEMLWSNVDNRKMIYDKGAVFLLIVMAGFSMMMAFAELGIMYIQM